MPTSTYPRPCWASLAKSAFGGVVALGVFTAGSAQAGVVVVVNGQLWDVRTFTGEYKLGTDPPSNNINTSKFATLENGGTMPWWGSQILAAQFSFAVGENLGLPNGDPNGGGCGAFSCEGPYFGYRDLGGTNGVLKMSRPSRTPLVTPTGQFTWAQASPVPAVAVPGPLPAFGAAAAFTFSRKLRKRIKSGAKTFS